MNSKQGSRYIKRRMGNDLKNQILAHIGIITEESAVAERKPSVLSCARCSLVNAVDNKFCSKCSYPLTPQAYEEKKDAKFKAMEQKYDTDIALLKDEVRFMREIMDSVLSTLRLCYVRYLGRVCFGLAPFYRLI
jgi:integrase/recombinase XerD